MPEADLTISISGKDVNATSMIEKLIRALDRLEGEAKDTSRGMASTAKAAEDSFNRTARAVQGAAGKISQSLRPMASMIGNITGLLGVSGLVGTIYKSVGAFSAFEDSMKEISTLISGDASAAVADYSKRIKQLSAESGKSTAELSKGLYQVISAGTKGTEDAAGAMNLLNIAQKAATAGVSNTFAAVDALTTTLNSYNRTTEDAANFSDIMFTTVKLGKTTFSELASKIGVVAATAANAKVDFGELNAGIAQLTKGGLSTDIAMTSLNALIVAMLKPSKELEAAVKKLGKGYTSVADMLGKEGLGGVMKFLHEQTGGNAEAMSKLIPSVEAGRAAAILAGGGFAEFEKTLGSFKNTTGSFTEAYNKMAESLSFKMQQFRAKVDLMFVEVGEKLMPITMGMLDDVSNWFNANSAKITGYLKEFSVSALEFLRFLVNHGEAIIKVMAAIWVTEKIASFTKSIMDLTEGFGKLKLAIAAVGAGPIIAGLMAVAAAVGAIGYAVSERGGLISPTKDPNALRPATEAEWAARQAEATASTANWRDAMRRAEGKKTIAEATDAAKKAAEDVSKTKRKLTEKEIEEAKKKREAALKYLDGLEVSMMNDRQKLQAKHEKEIAELRAQHRLTTAEKETAWSKLRERQAEEIAEYEYKQMDDRLTLEMAKNEEMARERAEMLVAAEKMTEAAGEEYHKRRLEWAEEVEKRELEALKRREEEDKKDWTKLAFWKEVGKGFAQKVGSTLFDWGLKVADVITTPLSAIVGMAGSLFGGFGTIGGSPFGKITEIFNSILGGAGTGDVQAATRQAALFFEQLAQRLPSALSWFASTGVPQIIDAFVTNLPTIIQALVEGIPVILDSVISSLDKIILPFVDGMLTLIPKLIELLPDLVGKLAELLGPAIAKIFENLPNILASSVTGVFKGIGSLFSGLVKGIGDIFQDKSKAQKAREEQAKVTETARRMGYTEEEAAKVGEHAYEKTMGRAYDPTSIAKYMQQLVHDQAISQGKSEEEAAALGLMEYDKQMARGAVENKGKLSARTSTGEVVDVGTHSYGSPYEGLISGPFNKAQAERAASKKAMEYYNSAFDRKTQEINETWGFEYERLMRRGVPYEEIEKMQWDYLEKGKQAALDAAEEAYQSRYKSILASLMNSPFYQRESAGYMHEGGLVERVAKAIRAHAGYLVPSGLSPDEVPIIAQTGEAVMNRRWVQEAGGKQAVDEMNRGGGGAGRVVNNVYVEHMMSGDTAQVVDRMLSDNLTSGAGKLYERFNTGRAVGYRTRRA